MVESEMLNQKTDVAKREKQTRALNCFQYLLLHYLVTITG